MDNKGPPIGFQQPPPYSETSTHHPGIHHPHMQQPPQPQTVIIPTQLGPNPQRITCPSCHAQVQTSVKLEPSSKTHMFALLMCIFGLWCCCCIPYCVDSCLSAQHSCPNCGSFIGTYSN